MGGAPIYNSIGHLQRSTWCDSAGKREIKVTSFHSSGEMTTHSRALAVLPEVLSSIPSTYMAAYNISNCSSKGSNALWCTHTLDR